MNTASLETTAMERSIELPGTEAAPVVRAAVPRKGTSSSLRAPAESTEWLQ